MKNPFKKIKNKTDEPVTLTQLLDMLNIDRNIPKNKLSEVTYFACIKILSESIGKLPIKLLISTKNNGVEKAVKHSLYPLIKYRPNPYMSASFFWGLVEQHRNHYGNAYVYINGYGTNMSLWLLPNESITVLIDNAALFDNRCRVWYIYRDKKTNKEYKFNSDEILHFRTSMTLDGYTGLSVCDILNTTLQGNIKSQQVLNSLYDNGFTAKAVLQYTGNINDDLTKKFVRGIENFASGKGDTKNIIPIPIGSTLQPLNISLTDAQFLEIKKYSALQIAAAFGIKPSQINDMEKTSYASAEAQSLSFYIDTLLYILKQYEEETTYKLLSVSEVRSGYHFKFNVAAILRADMKTQMDTLAKAIQNGIKTPNECREQLDLEKKDGGDILMTNGNMIPIKNVGMQYSQKKAENKDE